MQSTRAERRALPHHVLQCSEFRCRPVLPEAYGEPKVRQLDGLLVVRYQQVLGFNVAVHETLGVQVRDGGNERVDHRAANVGLGGPRAVWGVARAVDEVERIPAPGELEHDIHISKHVFEPVVKVRDGRVREAGLYGDLLFDLM